MKIESYKAATPLIQKSATRIKIMNNAGHKMTFYCSAEHGPCRACGTWQCSDCDYHHKRKPKEAQRLIDKKEK